MLCPCLLQALTEGLQLSLDHEPLGVEEHGDDELGGGDLAYHGGGAGVKGMHGVASRWLRLPLGSLPGERAKRE